MQTHQPYPYRLALPLLLPQLRLCLSYYVRLDAINAGTEIRLRADRKMGEVLILAKETGEIRDGRPTKRSDDSTVSLSAIGLSKDHSSTAQQLAKLSEQVFEARIEVAKATQQRLSTGRVLVQPEARQEKIERINQGNVSQLCVTPISLCDNSISARLSPRANR